MANGNLLFQIIQSEIADRELSQDITQTLELLSKQFQLSVNIGQVIKGKDFMQDTSNCLFYQDGVPVKQSDLDLSKSCVILKNSPFYCKMMDSCVYTLEIYMP